MSRYNNYQLYRTNVLLGGQLKWDIVIDRDINSLYISAFHMTPISNNLSFKAIDAKLTDHQTNLKTYFENNSKIFYDDGLSSQFKDNVAHQPIITYNDRHPVIYSNTYDMGCKRGSYRKYNKQFEFLCPLWLEHVNDSITFKISVLSRNGRIIGSKSLTLTDNKNQYHNQFVKYFNEYIKDLGLDNGDDSVLNIKFKNANNIYKGIAEIAGVDLSNGMIYNMGEHNISSTTVDFINGLTSSEMPLMNFNDKLINAFTINKMICKQLFNFNLCFNLADIVPNMLFDMMTGSNVKISVDVYVGDKLLSKKDFYTEYDTIYKECLPELNDVKVNVLDYMYDYKYIGNINKNKFAQNVCHWVLNENTDYTFNVYDGFSGVLGKEVHNDETRYYINKRQYGLTPNMDCLRDYTYQNATGWINTVTSNSWNDFYKYIKNPDNHKTNSIFIGESNSSYINSVKYNNIPELLKNKYLICIVVDAKLLGQIISRVNNSIEIYKQSLYMIRVNDLIILLTTNTNLVTFKMFRNHILWELDYIKNSENYKDDTLSDNQKYLQSIYKFLKGRALPECVRFNKILLYSNAEGPGFDKTVDGETVSNTDEIKYIYRNSTNINSKLGYVFRYDGLIKPKFTDVNSTLYYKDFVHNTVYSDTVYGRYLKSNYESKYPSIGYCGIKKLSNWSYDIAPTVNVTNGDSVFICNENLEYSWFNDNSCIVLTPVLKFPEYVNIKINGEYETMDAIICKLLSQTYGITDPNTLLYIKDLYDCVNNWSYVSNTNITDHKYNIILTLK